MIEEDPNKETYYEMGYRDCPIPVSVIKLVMNYHDISGFFFLFTGEVSCCVL